MTSSHAHAHGHPHDHSHSHSHGSWLGPLLDLDAQIHAGILADALTLISEVTADPSSVQRVLDIGAGTGTGSVALAQRFPEATVVAVDVNQHMLERVEEKATKSGLNITTMLADVSAAGQQLKTAQVVWSSAALHEVSNPQRAFKNLFDALAPGGILAVMEMDTPPRFLPTEFGEFENRLHGVSGSTPAVDHPDWAEFIDAAGFELLQTKKLNVDQEFPATGPAGEYAALELRRLGHRGVDVLTETDRNTYHTLTGEGPGNVHTLGSLWVRSSRTLWLARRP